MTQQATARIKREVRVVFMGKSRLVEEEKSVETLKGRNASIDLEAQMPESHRQPPVVGKTNRSAEAGLPQPPLMGV